MAEPGFSLFVDYATIGLIVTNMGLIIRAIRNGKRNHSRPGTGEICQKRGEKIAVLQTKQTRFEDDIREIKDDIKMIKGAVVK